MTPSIQGPISEGTRLLLICSLTHSQGHERFQWKHLDSAPTKSKLAVATPRNLEGHGSQMGHTLEIPQVSQKDMGTWECSVYGPEGRLGAMEYDLQITGTVPHGSANNLFSSPYLVLWCPFLSQLHPVLLPLDHLDPIFLSSSPSFHQFHMLHHPVPLTLSHFACCFALPAFPRCKINRPFLPNRGSSSQVPRSPALPLSSVGRLLLGSHSPSSSCLPFVLWLWPYKKG